MATYEELIAAAQAAQNEGRGDAARLLAQRAVDLRTSAEEEPEQTVIGSIARGAGAGLVSIPQGIAELGAAGIDLAADTELSRNTTEFFEDLKDKLGFTPERTAGRIAETLVNYGAVAIPVAGWLGAASQGARAARLGQAAPQAASRVRQAAYDFGRTDLGKALLSTRSGRVSRVGLAGTTALGTGLADILVDPSTNETLVDTWDALPDVLRTEDETGLINVVCSRGCWIRYRSIARGAPALLVRGRLEAAEGVYNVIAERIEALPVAASVPSRDFR